MKQKWTELKEEINNLVIPFGGFNISLSVTDTSGKQINKKLEGLYKMLFTTPTETHRIFHSMTAEYTFFSGV